MLGLFGESREVVVGVEYDSDSNDEEEEEEE